MSFLFLQPAPGILPVNSVDFSEVETIGANTILGNNTGSESVILELSKAQATAMLDSMSAATNLIGGVKGLVPSSSAGDQLKLLRAGADWATINTILDAPLIANQSNGDQDLQIKGVADSNLLFADASTSRIGIGTNTPSSKLQVVNSGSQIGLTVFSTSTNNSAELYNQGTTNYTLALNSAANSAQTGASIGGYFARGTLSSRTQTLTDDSLLSINASGYTGSSIAGVSAAIVLAADQDSLASSYGGQIVFATTPNDTVTIPQPRLTIKNDGLVGIGTALPGELLEVAGNVLVNNFAVITQTVRGKDNTGSSQHDITLRGGNGVTGNHHGGNVVVAGGTKSGTGTNGTVDIQTNSLSRIFIAGDGKVGISNSSPSEVLDVTGSAQVGGLKLKGSVSGVLTISPVNAVTTHTLVMPAAQGAANTALQNDGSGNLSWVKQQPLAKVERATTAVNYNIATTDDYVGCNTQVASLNLYLPAANTVPSGKKYIIKDEGGNTTTNPISLIPDGLDEIDGDNATLSMNVDYESLTLVCNGSDSWYII